MNKFTSHLNQVLARAKYLASLDLRDEISINDIISSIIEENGSLARETLIRAGMKINNQKENKSIIIDNIERNNFNVSFGKELTNLLPQTISWAAEYESRYVGTEHLLCAIVAGNYKDAREIFAENKIDINLLADNLKTVLSSDGISPENFNFGNLNFNAKDAMKEIGQIIENIEEDINAEPQIMEKKNLSAVLQNKISEKSKKKKSAIDFFARNLTDASVQNKIDPVIGRAKEIDRIVQILTRRTKNNPVLLGDAGVGKTAIVEGLAKKIVLGDVPDILIDKKIYSLDINMLLAGTVMRGEFEGRLKQVIDEAKENPNIILFIDEIHMIVGAGATGGSIDAANILKPALARGEIRCIGATTFEDYKKYIEDDSALDRRFQPVLIPEPTIEETKEILNGIKENYEKYHMVKINDSAINSAVELSARYISDRFLPDKAIDLLDEASSRIKIKKGSSPVVNQIRLLEEKIIDIENKKIKAIREEKYSDALNWRSEEEKMLLKIAELKEEVINLPKEYIGEINSEDIAKVISETKQIPLDEINLENGKDLFNLEDKLEKYILGQKEAIKEISFFIKRSRAGLNLPNRPLGSFIFLGPTGVGKTETAKVLAKTIFGSESRLVRIDMSEFSESFSASRLVGSPPGYIGFKEGGRLTEAIKRQSYSVVLFDEIEKAHPQIFNLLLQILEDGRLTDASGKIVNFRNTIIIMTSNVSLKNISESDFGFSETQKEKHSDYIIFKNKFIEILKKNISMEILGRIDRVVAFLPLKENAIQQIIEINLESIANRLKERNIKLNWSKQVIKFLVKKTNSEEYGAREVPRVIESEIETQIIEKILVGEIKKGDAVKLEVEGGKIIIK
jgi:ATP-dependent Clp protease ATP-binding subunit ClpC